MALPPSRPRLTRTETEPHLRRFGLDPAREPVIVFGVEGYYRDTMGRPGVNDRGIYDDLIGVITPHSFATFNGNVDPSRTRMGRGDGAWKGMADLKTETVFRAHRLDIHGGSVPHLALCQRAGPVTVIRDGNPPYPHTGMFGINIHRGGINGTSSEGCQTIPPSQWPEFIGLVQGICKSINPAAPRSVVVPYIVLKGPLT